ncbi:MAG: glycosyltransferase family 4 protein [Candidatus Symbiothrix sp.]|jgi:glycosyltransferase involved in cell wall biosynthesis|nr:glycosyltransferase family 4 protein [Candidatus Symbiothrix sp.]
MSNKILIEGSLIGNPYTGVYHYALQLGVSFSKIYKKKYDFLYLKRNNNNCFNAPKPFIQCKYTLYKYIVRHFWKPKIWHLIYHFSDMMPFDSKTKTLLTIHDLNFTYEPESGQSFEELQKRIDRADEIVVISNYVKNDVLKKCKIGGKTLSVIYNGCNLNEDLINSLSHDRIFEKRFIYTIGVMTRHKNFHILPYLLCNNDLFLIISGYERDLSYKKYILDKAIELGVSERVIFTGTVSEEDKFKYMRDCELFCFPSTTEGFGLPIIEAMRLGKKTLLSRHTVLPEIGGKYAYYLDSDDPEYLIDFSKSCLPQILEEKADRDNIISWAKKFSWDDAARKYAEIYNRLLN